MKRLLYIIVLALLASCGGNGEKPRGKATAKSQSAPYELLIVADKQWLKTTAGEALQEAVSPAIEGLPQLEPCFRVTSVAPSAFNSTFKAYAKIVMVDINRANVKPTYEVRTDVYCRPQTIVTFKAASDAELTSFLTQAGSKVVDLFNEQEFARERSLLKKHYSGAVRKAVQEMFGIGINAPEDIDDIKRGRDFLWASATKQENRLNVCVYTLPLVDSTPFDFIAVRDSVMKANIPGSRADQWMETDARTVSIQTSTPSPQSAKRKAQADIHIVRGLWTMRHDAMGGPFVSYVIPDTVRQRWLVAEGFVFAPEEKKRPLIRELEAMLQTIE